MGHRGQGVERAPSRSGLWLRLLGLGVSCGLLVLLVDPRQVVAALLTVGWPVALVALLMMLVRIVTTAVRWQLLLPPGTGLGLPTLVRHLMVGQAANIVMPGGLGVDVARSVLVHRETGEGRGPIFVSIAADRLAGLFAMAFLGAVGCVSAPWMPGRWIYGAAFVSLCASMVVAVLLVRSPRLATAVAAVTTRLGRPGRAIDKGLSRVFGSIREYETTPLRLAGALAISAGSQLLWCLLVYIVAQELGIGLSFWTLTTVTVVVWLVTTIPLSISGIGVREVSMALLLRSAGIAEELSGALALFQSALIVAAGLVGIPFLWAFKSRPHRGPSRPPHGSAPPQERQTRARDALQDPGNP